MTNDVEQRQLQITVDVGSYEEAIEDQRKSPD